MEIWKQIQEFPRYEISDLGRIRKIETGKVLKQAIHNGYPQVSLSFGKCKRKTVITHRLVGKYFIENPENKRCLNHIDGVKTNNNRSNLEWCSYQENSIHAWTIGLCKPNENQKASARIVQHFAAEKLSMPVRRSDGMVFKSIREAAKYLGKRHFCICLAAKGIYKKAYGYQWEYV
jgi:hypothetical protein